MVVLNVHVGKGRGGEGKGGDGHLPHPPRFSYSDLFLDLSLLGNFIEFYTGICLEKTYREFVSRRRLYFYVELRTNAQKSTVDCRKSILGLECNRSWLVRQTMYPALGVFDRWHTNVLLHYKVYITYIIYATGAGDRFVPLRHRSACEPAQYG